MTHEDTIMRNIEIKAKYPDFAFAKEAVAELGGHFHARLKQRDVYFNVPRGRLKLRFVDSGKSHLIFYERADQSGPKASSYEIYPTDNPEQLTAILAAALGVRAQVEKVREVYLIGNVRVHLDEVEKLGSFLEFEAVLGPEHDAEKEREKVAYFLKRFNISKSQLIETSYIDLLLNRKNMLNQL